MAPLNWGLGHATRCIPVVKELLSQNVNVVLAGSGNSLDLISNEFPLLKVLKLPDYNLHFNQIIPIGLHIILQSFKLKRNINLEKLVLDSYLSKNLVDGIISDNRYGFYSSTIPSVIITHQTKLASKTPFRNIANRLLSKHLANFSNIWIPDEVDSPLTGSLSNSTEFPGSEYLGILSRFEQNTQKKREEFVLVILSGTEPHRTNFENRIIKSFRNSSQKFILLRGLPQSKDKKVFPENFTTHNHLSYRELLSIMNTCKLLISRSGYSTIMDATKTGTPLILVPTKGQTEQEYLARRMLSEFQIPMMKEKKISSEFFSQAKKIPIYEENLLSSVIGKWLNQL